jgi:electron transfer flavoprotein beta subunit
MKILVLISQVPDTTARIAFTDGQHPVRRQRRHLHREPLRRMVRPGARPGAEGGQGRGSVTTITVGGADTEATIRKALAIGADDAVRVDAQPGRLPSGRRSGRLAKDKGFDLVLAGKETIDHNGGQVGAMVAELLDLPYVPLASKLDVNGGTATVERDVPAAWKCWNCPAAVVLVPPKAWPSSASPTCAASWPPAPSPCRWCPPPTVDVLAPRRASSCRPPRAREDDPRRRGRQADRAAAHRSQGDLNQLNLRANS